MSSTGEIVVSFKYDVTKPFSCGYATVRKGEFWTFVDAFGNEICPATFSDVDDFSGGVAPVKLKGKWGCVDSLGRIVIEPKFGWISKFSCGLAVASERDISDNPSWGFIDRKGNWRIKPQFSKASSYKSGVALVEFEGPNLGVARRKWSIIDTAGGLMIPKQDGPMPPYEVSDGLVPIKMGRKFAYIDFSGATVIKPAFYDARPFSHGLAAVQLENGVGLRWGYIDTHGNVVIRPVYQQAGMFIHGVASVVHDGKRGFINSQGKSVIDANYHEDHWIPFANGLSGIVSSQGDPGYIDPFGNFVPLYRERSESAQFPNVQVPTKYGLAESDVRKTFGEPKYIREFSLSEAIAPFRRSLEDKLPFELRESKLKELEYVQRDIRVYFWLVRNADEVWTVFDQWSLPADANP